jgi:UDP-N-acetylmuramyl pentapeptide synthase
MRNLQLSDIINNIDGELIKGSYNELITNVTTKPIKIQNKTLYFDLYESREIDFNSFSKFINFVIVTDSPEKYENTSNNITIVKVRDIINSYYKFVDFYRRLFDIPVIGITGTCGKTTTKEMIKHILSSKFNNIVATYKSRNGATHNLNYLMKIDDNTQAAAIEMGVFYPDSISIICRYFKPQIGVITTIGLDHLNKCRTLDNYIKAKSKLLDGMDNTGTLILNADDENIKKIDLSKYKGKVIYFGFNEPADFVGSELSKAGNGLAFTLQHDNKHYKVFVPVLGDFNAYNALSAIAASYELGIKIEDAVQKLKSFKNIESHVQIMKGINGSTIINDTWSTNPTSAEAALRMLKTYYKGKKTVAVLGQMYLLGSQSIELHHKLGEHVAELGIDYLITTDENSKYIGIGALKKGMSSNRIFSCIYDASNLDEIIKILNNLLDKNTVALVKTDMYDSYENLIDQLKV